MEAESSTKDILFLCYLMNFIILKVQNGCMKAWEQAQEFEF